MSEIVNPAQGLDPGGELRGFPLSVAEVVLVEVAVPLGGEYELALPTRRLLFDRFDGDRLLRQAQLRSWVASGRLGAVAERRPQPLSEAAGAAASAPAR